MKISVITTVLNAVDTIEKTIQSVLNQKYEDLEYIVIDAGSTDGTLEIIRKYEKDIDCLICEPDGGTFYGMNKGIENSSGDIIGIINADDTYLKDTFSTVNKAFLNSKIDVLYGNVLRKYDNGFTSVAEMCSPETLNYMMGIVHPAVFIRKEMYLEYGLYDTVYKYSSDYEYLLRLYRKGAVFKQISDVLAIYSMCGISIKNIEKSYNECKCISERYLPFSEDVIKYQKLLDAQENKRKRILLHKEYEADLIKRAGAFIETWSRGRQIYIYGCGRDSVFSYKILTNMQLKMNGYVDGDSSKQGIKLGEYGVYSPEILNKEDAYVLVSSRRCYLEMEDFLIKKDYVRKEDFISLKDLIEGGL